MAGYARFGKLFETYVFEIIKYYDGEKTSYIFMERLRGRAVFSAMCGYRNDTVSPTASHGNTYAPGQVVSFCYTVDNFDQIADNWFHGVTFTFGPGWNDSTFTVISKPSPASMSGSWDYYAGGDTSYATEQVFGAGFYFGTNAGSVYGSFAADGDNPGENYGDECPSGSCSWTFCFSLQVNANAAPGTSLELKVLATSDGISGSWSSPACSADGLFTLCTATVGNSLFATAVRY